MMRFHCTVNQGDFGHPKKTSYIIYFKKKKVLSHLSNFSRIFSIIFLLKKRKKEAIYHPEDRGDLGEVSIKKLIRNQNTVELRYSEVLGTMKISMLYQVSHYIRVKEQRNIKSWDQQNYLFIRGFCYIRPVYNEVPL